MDEGFKFIARLLDGDKMSALCRVFGISRKTGYNILKRLVFDISLRWWKANIDHQRQADDLGRSFEMELSHCSNLPVTVTVACEKL